MIYSLSDFLDAAKDMPPSRITDYDVEIADQAIPFPIQDAETRTFYFGRVIAAKVSSGTKNHTVCIGYTPQNDRVSVWCGAAFLEKETYNEDAINASVANAVGIGEVR